MLFPSPYKKIRTVKMYNMRILTTTLMMLMTVLAMAQVNN